MNEDQVAAALTKLFEEGHRVVFWNDADREFEETVPTLSIDGVTVLRLDGIPALEAKMRIEREEPNHRFLLYAPSNLPPPSEDWLLDVRLYSRAFRADRASIVHGELGLAEQHLCDHLAARGKFLASKDRLARLKKLIEPTDTASGIDRKMLAVLLKLDQHDFLNVLTALYQSIPEGDLDGSPAAWEDIEKFDLAAPFWKMVQEQFGYTEGNPSLRNLLIRLVVTDLAHSATQELPPALKHLQLPKTFAANASVCLSQWRDSYSRSQSYDRLSKAVADALKLDTQLGGFEIEALLDTKTFLMVEKYIASALRDRVIDTASAINAAAIKAIATRRQDGYWAVCERPSTAAAPREAMHAVYDALIAAADLFELRGEFGTGFAYTTAQEMFRAYAERLYRFDRLYRDFTEAADKAKAQGWDILKTLRDRVEDCYGNWFLTNLSLKWGSFVEADLLKEWRVPGVMNQQELYRQKITAALMGDNDRRAFVIISDALRYEAAQELADDLNGTYRIQASIDPLLGVLPSYTALGMAALLPHKKLTYTDKGEVLADGQPTGTLQQRSDILASVGGIAVKADDLRSMKKDEGRAFVKPHKVVYVYHNVIDATGDHLATEADTFDAVRKAVVELSELVRLIMNNLNGSYILVTADHGFLYQETAPDLSDKNALSDKPLGTIKAKKRYLLGRNLPDSGKAYHGSTETTAKADGAMEFWVPKGNNRFHFVGGARFVHGGAMLQEIVVPLVTVREAKGASKQKTKTKQVGVTVLGSTHKITTNRCRFELIQTERVSDRVKPVTLDIAVYEDDAAITNVQRITFDSESENFDERKKQVILSLQNRTYDKKSAYHLILRNTETGVEESRVEVTINIAFTNDF